MKPLLDEIRTRVRRAIETYEGNRARARYDDLSDLGDIQATLVLSMQRSTIESLQPLFPSHRASARSVMEKWSPSSAVCIPFLHGVLLAIEADLECGLIDDVATLVKADLFSDFLEMAEHLMEQGYKDPAVVMGGAVLEQTLRQLAEKAENIQVTDDSGAPKRASALNDALMKEGTYPKSEHKQVQAWLDRRNSAAHGKYDDYDHQSARLFLEGIRHFLNRYVQ